MLKELYITVEKLAESETAAYVRASSFELRASSYRLRLEFWRCGFRPFMMRSEWQLLAAGQINIWKGCEGQQSISEERELLLGSHLGQTIDFT